MVEGKGWLRMEQEDFTCALMWSGLVEAFIIQAVEGDNPGYMREK